MLCFYAAKGGAGCSVVAAAVSLLLADRGPAVLVDLAGDQSEILGLTSGHAPDGEGLDSWLASDRPSPDALRWSERPVTEQLSLLATSRTGTKPTEPKLALLAALLRSDSRRVVVDLGAHDELVPFVAQATRSVLVTRPCYVALSRARLRPPPDDIVLVLEPHRALTSADVQAVLGAPIAATVTHEPQVFRAVDAGLLVSRLPRSLRRLDVF